MSARVRELQARPSHWRCRLRAIYGILRGWPTVYGVHFKHHPSAVISIDESQNNRRTFIGTTHLEGAGDPHELPLR